MTPTKEDNRSGATGTQTKSDNFLPPPQLPNVSNVFATAIAGTSSKRVLHGHGWFGFVLFVWAQEFVDQRRLATAFAADKQQKRFFAARTGVRDGIVGTVAVLVRGGGGQGRRRMLIDQLGPNVFNQRV